MLHSRERGRLDGWRRNSLARATNETVAKDNNRGCIGTIFAARMMEQEPSCNCCFFCATLQLLYAPNVLRLIIFIVNENLTILSVLLFLYQISTCLFNAWEQRTKRFLHHL
jgi:hypothetical protein